MDEVVEKHREALEALAAHGKTQLAADARTLLDKLETGG